MYKGSVLKIIADTRELAPYTFTNYDVEIVKAGLPAGDYSLPGAESVVAIERKTVDDLVGCLMGKDRERFARELARLRPYVLAAVVCECTLEDISRARYVSNMKPQAALQSIIAMQVRYGVPLVWAGNRNGGEYVTHGLLQKYAYEIRKQHAAINKAVEI